MKFGDTAECFNELALIDDRSPSTTTMART
jgi:hypothetical protein